jgi:hypothetical protein
MPGLADVYARLYDKPSHFTDRNKSAAMLTSMIPYSGYAAPAVALAAGQEMKAGQEGDAQTRQVESFLATFEKLATVAPGEAVAFFNQTAPKVLGKDVSPIDSVKADNQMTSVHFTETGEWGGINKGTGQVQIFDPEQKKWRAWTAEDGERMKSAKTAKADKTSTIAIEKESRQLLTAINQTDSLIAKYSSPSMAQALGTVTVDELKKEYPALDVSGGTAQEAIDNAKTSRQALRDSYVKITGKNPWKNKPAPIAPAGGTAAVAGYAPGAGINPSPFPTPTPQPTTENWRAYLK